MDSITVEIKNERQPVTVERRDEHEVVRQVSVERCTDEVRQVTVETRQAIISIPANDPVIHRQLVASSMWTIAHNLGRLVDPIVYDENDCRIIGEVRPDSDNQVTLIFSEPVAGSARIF